MTVVNPVVSQTQRWIEMFIVAHNICPFARREVESQRIRYDVCQEYELEKVLHCLIALCEELDEQSDTETAFLILADGFTRFDEYLDLLELADALLVRQGYEGVYQLASFHPDYCFDGVEETDASHFTNRSPYPMLHIIREASIERALEHFADPEGIPERNIAHCQSIGRDVLKAILDECSHSSR